MALRYSADDLLHLRASSLCTKPERLPPAEEWMGAPLEQIRAQAKANTNERPRTGDNPLHDNTNRRPGYERHASRNSANPEDIVFAPPRMAFASARGAKPHDHEGEGLREPDSQDRFGRNIALRRRNDTDQDSDGWTPVKPRKSFGADGAERFVGRMGNFRDEKRPQRERDERESTRERPMRNFDSVGRDRAVEDEARPRNGVTRNKSEQWTGKPEPEPTGTEKRERIDRAKSWRDRDPVIEDDRRNKQKDRRWGRDNDNYRNEQEPEWFDEPVEPKQEKRTQQDFQKWMEEMKKAKSSAAAADQPASSSAAANDTHKAPVQSAPAIETGPDKFFLNFGGSSGFDASSPAGEQPSQAPKSKAPGKSSRFTSFFNAGPQAASPATPVDEPQPRAEHMNPLAALSMGALAGAMPPASAPSSAAPQGHHGAEDERQAFQQLIMKLHKQSATATPPGLSPFSAPSSQQGPPSQAQPPHEQSHGQRGSHAGSKKGSVASPESFQQYGMGGERRDGPMGPPPQQNIQDIMSPQSQGQSQAQSQAAYSNQLMQDIMGHHRRLSSQTSQRAEPNPASRNNSNTEFLMNLMRTTPNSQGPQQHNMPMGQPPKQSPMPQPHEREPDYARDSRASQRSGRPQQPPGFGMDEPFHHPDADQRQNHPTQILQRPGPPPGLDQMGHNWMPGGGQMPPPPQQRGGPMAPPPGLAGGPSRNMPMQHMFPPNFPPGGMPPPDGIGGMPPPRNMPPPPPGFFNGPPPPGYLPPGMDGFGGPPPGMDSHFMGSPFEGGRGMPPPGNGGRGAFGRQ